MVKIDELIRTRRRSIALIIQRDGRLVVRAPLGIGREAIQGFVRQKETWIRRRQEQIRAQQAFMRPKEYNEGETFLFLGNGHGLHLVDRKKPELCLEQDFLLSRLAHPIAAMVFKRWYRRQAMQFISRRVEMLAAQHGYSYQKVRISSARTRWGSCSSRGTLSFSWRLVMAPPEVIDYVVLHELAHLKIHNHSQQFWRLVGELLPVYREQKVWLQKNGHLLTID